MKGKKWQSAILNNQTFIDYYQRLTEIAINMYEWHNLPDTIDERFLELALHQNGAAVFFEDEVIGYLALETMYGGQLDVYRIPNDRRAYAVNGYNKQLDATNSVLMFNNFLRTPGFKTLELFAMRLYEIERAIDVNVKAQKTPVMILSDEKQRLTMKNLYMQYDGNEPFIFGDKKLNIDEVKALKTEAPFVSLNLQQLKRHAVHEHIIIIHH